MSSLPPDLQAWWDSTPDAGVQPDESVYLSQEKVKNLIKNSPKEIALIDLRKNDFTVSTSVQGWNYLYLIISPISCFIIKLAGL
jgi:hypothetical protein